MQYDYLIVGAEMLGATFARLATDTGTSCLVIDKGSHIGENCYTEKIEGINAHNYGAHVFHTTDEAM
jgi:UDP-galactopyranose mutase